MISKLPLINVDAQEMKFILRSDACISVFTEALFTGAREWYNLSVHQLMNASMYPQSNIISLQERRKLCHAETWMVLENIPIWTV